MGKQKRKLLKVTFFGCLVISMFLILVLAGCRSNGATETEFKDVDAINGGYLTWTAIKGASYYDLYDGDTKLNSDKITVNKYKISIHVDQDYYCIRVKAQDEEGKTLCESEEFIYVAHGKKFSYSLNKYGAVAKGDIVGMQDCIVPTFYMGKRVYRLEGKSVNIGTVSIISSAVREIANVRICKSESSESITIPMHLNRLENTKIEDVDAEKIKISSYNQTFFCTDDGLYARVENGLKLCRYFIGKENVRISDEVVAIGRGAFAELDILKLEIPDSVVDLDEAALSFMLKLQNIKLGKGITYLPKSCFIATSIYTNPIELVLPNGLERICSEAMAGANVADLYIPQSVVIIEDYGIGGVYNLIIDGEKNIIQGSTNIHCEASEKPQTWSDEWLSIPDTNGLFNSQCIVIWS